MDEFKKVEKSFNTAPHNIIYLILIFVVTLFLGVGYAQVTGVSLSIDGSISSSKIIDIYISKVEYVSSIGTSENDSTINDFNLTVLNSTVALSNSNTSSSITYRVTIKNTTETKGTYDQALFVDGLGYDNQNIDFVVSGINQGYELNPGEQVSFNITFKYVDGLSNITNNVLNSYINFRFQKVDKVARIGNNYYDTLQNAINAVPTNNTETTIILLKDYAENITINKNQNVVLNLNGKTLSNDGNYNVINNNGTLNLTNGTINCDADTNGAVNNNNGAVFTMNDGRIISTGGRQALYNDGGNATVGGTAYLSATTNERAAVENKKNSGTITITGGTIISTGSYGVKNAGTMTIGTQGGTPSRTSPILQGVDNGIYSTTNYNFYDGIIKSRTLPRNNDKHYTVTKENGYDFVASNETISGQIYQTNYLGIPVTVTFNPNGGAVNEPTRNVEAGQTIGELPVPTWKGHEFVGWFTSNDGGDAITASTIINSAVTYFAHWETASVAEINGTRYQTLQAAIDKAKQNGTVTTITIIKNISESVTIRAGKNIVLDLAGKTISNDGNKPIIENHGTLSISNGTFHSTAEQSIINQVEGTLNISGGSFTITSTKQVLYITGGTATISGDTHMESNANGFASGSSMERGTVHNVSGTLNILGGTIIANNSQVVSNESTLTIGSKDGNINTTTPVLRGAKYGINSTGTLNFYDGIAEGKTDAIIGTLTDIETDSQLTNGSETIGGQTYITGFLEIIQQNND